MMANKSCDCFDFPVSWTFYRAHCWEQHGFDPGSNELPNEKEIPEPITVITKHIYVHDVSVQVKKDVHALEVKVNTLLDKKEGGGVGEYKYIKYK